MLTFLNGYLHVNRLHSNYQHVPWILQIFLKPSVTQFALVINLFKILTDKRKEGNTKDIYQVEDSLENLINISNNCGTNNRKHV